MDFNLLFFVVVVYGVVLLYVLSGFLGNHTSTAFVTMRDIWNISIYLVFTFFVNGSCPGQ